MPSVEGGRGGGLLERGGGAYKKFQSPDGGLIRGGGGLLLELLQ